jgi:2-succinyl-5-enolpyruvyl-6-hydroxy-3-cyclohexene-1-carboxylate synthase
VISSYDLLLRDEHFRHRVVPDLVLRFGELPTSKPLRSWLAASGADQIVVDPDGGWNEPTRRAAAILRADPTELAAGWAARVGRGDRDAAQVWLEAERAAAEALAAELDGNAALTEPALHRALGAAHEDDDLVYTASSMPIRDQEAFLPSGEADVLFLCNRGANGIDGLVSSGIGAAAATGRPATIVTGDLGLLHDIGGLAALRELDTPVRVLVIDNDGGGIFHFLPQAEALDEAEFEALLGTPRGVDAAAAAALFGLPHRRLDSLAGLPDALAAGTGLIEVPVERRANADLHRRLAERVSAAIGSST